MSDKNIKNFLPSVFRTNKIKNFMDSTSETLFSDNNSENKTYYVGQRVGGLYDPLTDYYATEINKIREDYQLEPSLVVRTRETNEVEDILTYEDLLNALKNDGCDINDHSELFKSTSYSFAPPIDIDMFINYSDYYWYPEGGFTIEVDANPNDLVGMISAQVRVIATDEALNLSSGMNLKLNDGNVYIVEGVGTYIELIEFDPENNKPFRIDRVYNTTSTSDDLIERFPAEYITMERGAIDRNPWSRNNSWFHKDVINKIIGQTRFFAERERRAQRPIICFRKNIELFDYGNHVSFVKTIGTTLDTDMNGASIENGDLVIVDNDPVIYEYNGGFTASMTVNDGEKVTIYDGNNKADEYRWDMMEDNWVMCQRKLYANQHILFNLYDSNESDATRISDTSKYPNSSFQGNEIFKYGTSETSLEDPVLGFGLKYKAFKESSDIVFENAMTESYEYEFGDDTVSINNTFYKINNPLNLDNNILKFTIGKTQDKNPTVLINNKSQKDIVVSADIQYRLDYSDSSTTIRSWYEDYSPIQILDKNGQEVIRPTHADSSRNTRVIDFDLALSPYTYKTSYFEGYMHVVEQTVEDYSFENSWKRKETRTTELKLQTLVSTKDDLRVELTYTPYSDSAIKVSYNGDALPSSEYYFDVNAVQVSDDRTVNMGDYIEVFYSTNDKVRLDSEEIQIIHPTLNINPYNNDIEEFAFSEIFDQFRSIIRNQPFLRGTALTDNNYRDTIKDGSLGTSILKHETPMLPLMFSHLSDQTNVIDSVESAKDYYRDFKNRLQINAEQYIRDNDIDESNVRDIFDNIVTDINSGRRKTDPYAYSFMFATYNKYTNVSFDASGLSNTFLDIDPDNHEFYVYTSNGLRLIDIDYTLEVDYQTMESTLVPHTFNIDDVTEARYYKDMEPSFCAPTPMKFGLDRPKKPEIILDETYSEDRYFIVGHDGSKTLCYSSNADITNNQYDGRDLILLEFEKRIYNGIRPEFKDQDIRLIGVNGVYPTYFKTTDYSIDAIREIEFRQFNKWCNENNVDYTENTLYENDNIDTYNIPPFKANGVEVSGHWKSIFQYYYGTIAPNKTPWEMLEFRIKPSWWDNEYGNDYSSNNTYMWGDIEQGIIRQGIRENVSFDQYKSSENTLKKEGLSNILPVDGNGDLLSVVDIGIVDSNTFDYYKIKRSWSFGENGPAELAWKYSSDYVFTKQIVNYTLKPLIYVTKAWDTKLSANIVDGQVLKPSTMGVHSFYKNSSEFNYVPGLSQWIYSYLQSKNLSGESLLRDKFNETGIQLSHKVGGFIDSQNLSVTTETFNPRSDSTITNIPREDISVLLHESKDISEEVYSGVMVERIEAEKAYDYFIEGAVYNINDVVYNRNDKNYYRLKTDHLSFTEWGSFRMYSENRVVRFSGRLYICDEAHQSIEGDTPENNAKWSLRGFVQSDWELLTSKPDAKTTHFKVFGYDIYDSTFYVIPASDISPAIEIRTPTIDSEPVTVVPWEPNKNYSVGVFIRVDGGNLYYCNTPHTSGDTFEVVYWTRSDRLSYTNMASVMVSTEGRKNTVKAVPYGTVFRTQEEVAEFLMAYGRYLESKGWMFDQFDSTHNKFKNWKLSVEEFIKWAYENKTAGNVIGLSPISEDIRFSAPHGVPSVSRNKINTPVTLMGNRGNIIDPKNAEYNRTDGVFEIMIDQPIYYCRLSLKEYEHIITVNNRTVFNDVLYYPELGIRKDRLRINSRKTKGWDGRLRSEGFIISNDKILPNFETSINDIRSISKKDEISVQDVYNRLKHHNYGYENRDYLEGLSMDEKAQISFYEGFVKQKGTSESFQRLLRSAELDVSDDTKINEEWAFREGNFGAIETDQSIEVVINKTDMISTPQPLYLEYNSTFENKKATDIYVDINDNDTWIIKPDFLDDGNAFVETKLGDVKTIPTAGYVRWSDADFKAFTLSQLSSVISSGSSRNITQGTRAWIAKDTNEEYGWNLYQSDDTNIEVTEIITLGRDGVSSAVLRMTGNIDANNVYGFYNDIHAYTFKLRKISPNDNVYILLSLDEDEYITFDNEETESYFNDTGFVRWVPSRVNKFHHTFFSDVQDTIDTFITDHQVSPYNGYKLYVDEAQYTDSYKSVVMQDNPLEFWRFNDGYTQDGYDGISTSLYRPSDISVPSNVMTNYNKIDSNGLSYDASVYQWPEMLWGNVTTHQQNVIEAWINNIPTPENIQQLDHVYPFFGTVWEDTNNSIYSAGIAMNPQTRNLCVFYTIDGVVEFINDIEENSGYNHVALDVSHDTTTTITVFVNGTKSVHTTNHDNNSFVNQYVYSIENTNDFSRAKVDEVALYTQLSHVRIQDHYIAGINGKFNSEPESKWAVYRYDGTQWVLDYEEQHVIDTNLIHEVLIYETENNEYLSNLKIHDPVKGYFAGAPIQDVDYITEYDPVRYSKNGSYSSWGEIKVGTVWWDTSTMRYLEYENGTEEDRINFWGTLFPNSTIDIYEWIQSPIPPEEYVDVEQGTPYNLESYVIEDQYNEETNETVRFYYFWVKDTSSIPENTDREVSIVNIANAIRYPENNSVDYVDFISNRCVLLHDVSNQMVQNDFVLQIKYAIINDDIETHSQWHLISEEKREDEIPSFVFDKMIDSVLGYTKENASGNVFEVPDTSIPETVRYGNSNTPRQSWFIDIHSARRNFFEIVNEALAGLNVWDIELFWERTDEDVLRDTKYFGLVDWYADDYDPLTIVSNLVNKRSDIMLVPLNDGEYVQVNESVGRMPSVYETGFTIYRYHADINSYEKVGQSRAQLQLKEAFYTDEIIPEDAAKIRDILEVALDIMIDKARPEFINKIFFTMVRYVFTEQPTNDWVFPSTYINVNHEVKSLIKKRIFSDDKEEEMIGYITEAKPFHTKLRTINKIATGDIEYNGFYVTDFDKPPFINQDRSITILQEEIIDTIPYKKDLYYNLSIVNARPVEYWPMNVKYSPSTIAGTYGTNFYNRDGDYDAIPSGISFNNGYKLHDNFSTDSINIASSKLTFEGWFFGHDISEFGSMTTLEVANINVVNSSDTSDVVSYKVVADIENGAVVYKLQAFRGNVPYLDIVLDFNPYVMNYLVLNIDNSSSNTKVHVSVNALGITTHELGTFINVNDFYDVDITIGSSDFSYFYDEFALYERNLSLNTIEQHYDFASETVPQRVFTLENTHDMSSLNVYIEGSVLPTSEYTITGNQLRLSSEPPRAVNHVSNIVVKSNNLAHQSILADYDQARGYIGVNKNNMTEWMRTVNQKRTCAMFDRVSITPTLNLETLLQRYEDVLASDKPLGAFTAQSKKFINPSIQKFTEVDRIATNFYHAELEALVNASYIETVNAPRKKNFFVNSSDFDTDNIVVLVDDSVIPEVDYTLNVSGGNINISMDHEVRKNSSFIVRPKDMFEDFIFKVMHHRGVGVPYKNLVEIREIGFNVDEDTTPIRVDESGELIVDSDYEQLLEESEHTISVNVLYSEFDDEIADIKDADKFLRNAEEAIPEEKTELSLKEALVFTFKSNLNVVPKGYETNTPMDIFDTVSFTSDGTETEYPITLNVPKEQVLVLVNEDEWVMESTHTGGNHHYTLEPSEIVFNRPLQSGDKVIITDRYSAYDSYNGNTVSNHRNIQGGYDGDFVVPDHINTKEDVREFILYTQDGRVHVFECPESDAIIVNEEIIYSDTSITLSEEVTDDMKLANHDQGKLAVIYATIKPEYKVSQEYADLEMKPVDTKLEFIHYTNAEGNTISSVTRGLFGKNPKDFDSDKYNITVYPLTVDDSLPSFTISEPYIGIKGRPSYPKYGHIMSGSD